MANKCLIRPKHGFSSAWTFGCPRRSNRSRQRSQRCWGSNRFMAIALVLELPKGRLMDFCSVRDKDCHLALKRIEMDITPKDHILSQLLLIRGHRYNELLAFWRKKKAKSHMSLWFICVALSSFASSSAIILTVTLVFTRCCRIPSLSPMSSRTWIFTAFNKPTIYEMSKEKSCMRKKKVGKMDNKIPLCQKNFLASVTNLCCVFNTGSGCTDTTKLCEINMKSNFVSWSARVVRLEAVEWAWLSLTCGPAIKITL